VRTSAANFATFEEMHYVCFHYEFEHDPADPDEECQAGGCPSGALLGGRDRVAETARAVSLEAIDPAVGFENGSLPRYLSALAAWLDDSDGYYLHQRRVPPSNAWEIINDALRAAKEYE
jgi:hypothetical protein